MKNFCVAQPFCAPADTGGTGGGIKELDKAIAVLGQINILIPVAYGLGKTLVGLIKNAQGVDAATLDEARAAVAGFEVASTDLRQSSESWLDTHPRI